MICLIKHRVVVDVKNIHAYTHISPHIEIIHTHNISLITVETDSWNQRRLSKA